MSNRKSGNPPRYLRDFLAGAVWSVLLCLLPQSSFGALTASLDRYRIAMGETVNLTLRSDDGSDPGDADLSALEEHFEVLGRSTRVSTSSINGQRSQLSDLLLELTPRREGSVVIPPFVVGQQRSEALSVDITAPPKAVAQDETVLFEAELDRDSVYVQGQLLLTLRIQQAVNLDGRSITELDIDNAYVESLGQNSFQRNVDGRPWLVHEIRYAIFPEASGELLIPAQAFSGRLGSGRRTLFDTRAAGRMIRRETEAIRVPVMPRPDAYPAATWLPSSSLSVEEQWSTAPDSLRIGDSVTRTITVTADGLQGAQLSPISDETVDGLRSYPDQPVINNVSSDQGVVGIRVDSVALVAVSDGAYVLPAVEIPWWNTETDSLQIARLPERRITVMQSAQSAGSSIDPAASPENPVAIPGASASGTQVWWPYIAAICALGWLGTSALWWRSRRQGDYSAGSETRGENLRSGNARKAILSACAANDAVAARAALNQWMREQASPTSPALSLRDWLRRESGRDDTPLLSAIDDLENHLYGSAERASWNGETLATALRDSRGSPSQSTHDSGALPALYPGSANG